MDLTIESRGGVHVIRLYGELDASAADKMLPQLRLLASTETPKVVVDLDGIRLMNSVGLGTLIAGSQTLAKAGGALALARPQAAVRRVLALARIQGLAKIYDDLESALAALGS